MKISLLSPRAAQVVMEESAQEIYEKLGLHPSSSYYPWLSYSIRDEIFVLTHTHNLPEKWFITLTYDNDKQKRSTTFSSNSPLECLVKALKEYREEIELIANQIDKALENL